MPTYVYCFVDPAAADPPAGAEGIDGEPVRRLDEAWVSEVRDRTVRPTLRRVRQHDAVIALALDTGMTPLPARFGQTFASDAECQTAMAGKRDELRTARAQVAGCVEMRLLLRPTVRLVEKPKTEALSAGTAYLQALLERERSERAVRSTLEAAAGPLVDAMALFVRETAVGWNDDGFVAVAHLVDRQTLPSYRAHLEVAINAVDSGVSVKPSGPSAPYSFGTLL
jgi:Gas vesicle synthesis protein GvpL/GvpF